MEEMPIKCRLASYRFYRSGCERALMAWIRRSADVLFVLGYCVISFLKLCFLGILRYEIREMIQKIKILHGDTARLELVNVPQQTTGKLLQKVEHNGSVVRVSTPMRQDTLTEGSSDAVKPLLKGRSVEATFRVKSSNADGNESDTNSHSALLCDDKRLTGLSSKSNYELHELKDVNRLLNSRNKNQI